MNSSKSSLRSSQALCLRYDGRLRGCFFDSWLSMSQPLGSPTKTNPLANVVRQASPQGLGCDLEKTAQPKLPKPDFLFDPGVGKLCHPGSLLVDLLGLFSLHLGFKRHQLSGLFPAQQRPPLFSPGTTLVLKRTASTIRNPRPVAPLAPAALPFLGFKAEPFTCRTPIGVSTRIITEGLRIKFPTDSVPLQHVPRGFFLCGRGPIKSMPLSAIASMACCVG